MEQNYSNHRRWIPMYHFVLSLALLATVIGSIVNLIKSFGTEGLYNASLIFVLSLSVLILSYFTREFALKAQDRAIRAEEKLRHYILTQKLPDPRLTTRQMVGLRFAPDDEFVELANKAAEENLSGEDIKKAIKNWKEDTYRV
ncbi:DUF6526 family protein [candidate division KSB1 bacterium]